LNLVTNFPKEVKPKVIDLCSSTDKCSVSSSGTIDLTENEDKKPSSKKIVEVKIEKITFTEGSSDDTKVVESTVNGKRKR
jgi:hypothetical protein